jgi:hypothetical protein
MLTLANANKAQLRFLSVAMTHNDRIAQGRTCDRNPRRAPVCAACHPGVRGAIDPKVGA